MEWQKIFGEHTSNKRLRSRLYKRAPATQQPNVPKQQDWKIDKGLELTSVGLIWSHLSLRTLDFPVTEASSKEGEGGKKQVWAHLAPWGMGWRLWMKSKNLERASGLFCLPPLDGPGTRQPWRTLPSPSCGNGSPTGGSPPAAVALLGEPALGSKQGAADPTGWPPQPPSTWGAGSLGSHFLKSRDTKSGQMRSLWRWERCGVLPEVPSGHQHFRFKPTGELVSWIWCQKSGRWLWRRALGWRSSGWPGEELQQEQEWWWEIIALTLTGLQAPRLRHHLLLVSFPDFCRVLLPESWLPDHQGQIKKKKKIGRQLGGNIFISFALSLLGKGENTAG